MGEEEDVSTFDAHDQPQGQEVQNIANDEGGANMAFLYVAMQRRLELIAKDKCNCAQTQIIYVKFIGYFCMTVKAMHTELIKGLQFIIRLIVFFYNNKYMTDDIKNK